MQPAEKLDDFAHDVCVSGLGIAFLCIVSVAGCRPDSRQQPVMEGEDPMRRSATEIVLPGDRLPAYPVTGT